MRVPASSLWLILLNSVLLGGLGVLLSTPSTAHWLPAASVTPAPAPVPPPQLPDLPEARLATAWTRPIFSPTRQPDAAPASPAERSLSDVKLSGVMLDGEARWAYLRAAGGRRLKLALGDSLPGGWRLSQIDADAVTFSRNEQTQTLRLPRLRLPPASNKPVPTLPRSPQP